MVLEKGESNPDADTVPPEDVDLRYTEYPEGYMTGGFGVNPHCSWVAVSDARSLGIWEWMFQKQGIYDIIYLYFFEGNCKWNY